MNTQRRIISVAVSGLLFASLSATRFAAAAPHSAPLTQKGPAACTLLTTTDAVTALGVPSQPGKEFIDSTGCVWSNDPNASDSSRRVIVNTHSVVAFQAAKRPAITTIKIEPLSGIGDEAFYQVYPRNQPPFIWVRKGNIVFSIRIITPVDPKPFTIEQEKSKEVVLAKAAVAKI